MLSPKRLAPPLCIAAALVFAAPATANFDQLPGEPFDPASDTPYTSAAPVTKVSPIFDTTNFGEDSGELTDELRFLGCGRWGARTAWVRFATRVTGRVNVSVDSSIPGPGGHDVFFKAYTAPSASPDYSQVSDEVSPGNTPCSSGRIDMPDEQGGPFPVTIPAGQSRVLYIQVLSKCADRPGLPPCSQMEREAAQGGNTNVTITYMPDDTDSDGVADSLDSCPRPTDPCNLDSDGDGINDAADACRFQRNPCAVDADGDGFSKNAVAGQAEDCNDADRDVNPGETERRGNRKDDDCDGRALPYLRVTNKVKALFGGHGARADHFNVLAVRGARRGLLIIVECRGRGCPDRSGRYQVKRRGALFSVRGTLGRVRLRPGARVTVKLLRKGRIGKVLIYRFPNVGAPKEPIERCTLPGRSRIEPLSRCAPRGPDAASRRS